MFKIPFFSQYNNIDSYYANNIQPLLRACSFKYINDSKEEETIYLVRQYILSKDDLGNNDDSVQFKPQSFYLDDANGKVGNELNFEGTLKIYNFKTDKIYKNKKINVILNDKKYESSLPEINIKEDLKINTSIKTNNDKNNYFYYIKFTQNNSKTYANKDLYTPPKTGNKYKTYKGLYWISYKDNEDIDNFVDDNRLCEIMKQKFKDLLKQLTSKKNKKSNAINFCYT
jgi:hypothetical protein